MFTPRGGQEGSSSATVVHFDADAHPERAQELLLSVFDAVTYVQYLCRVIKESDLDNVHKQHRHEAKALRGKVRQLRRGEVWHGHARHGMARQFWRGRARLGHARHGLATQLRHGHWSMFDVRISIIHLERRK